jgi:uncharacterized membrane protein YebE (DUF533 family)
MFDPKKLLDDLLGSTVPGTQETVRTKATQVGQMAKDNPLKAGALAAVLLGTGVGRSVTGSALKLGGVAVVAGLAYKAFRNYHNAQPTDASNASAMRTDALPPALEGELELGASSMPDADEFALALVRAMIAAARADGHIDAEEHRRIAEKLSAGGYDEDAQRFISAELANPVDIDAIVNSARTQAQKIELYTASRLAIDPQTRAERGYLDMLAGRLALPEALLDHIDATIRGAHA